MKLYVKKVESCWECPSYFNLPLLSRKECHHRHRKDGCTELRDGEDFCECCPLDNMECVDYE